MTASSDDRLLAARAIASRPVEDSADADHLRLLVFELCDEIERLRGSLDA